ncbi:long chain polyunsaturated fatty acid elongation enzyme, putative [Plasmodium vivax]|uniref:Elongation of fatty acids protein n=6 Tax=Plasmodium vivax TaxID=5855 RepID=A5K1Q7_PLAVS|nr:long chain polyunsaturated fatty acid elongation enzyme, putative [Plasmodium vivax]KMZ79395.1 long chain polyunsaturated fatty acid elongation enzyme [Plasmodium vivax India VII]KMZ85781.1 long chain polyunsaturated fatty acid elongation enzyme [Plasmodium vivax Brazil I]KMZ92255.1 long chain polyunsaturated fatty acid elongation enzyme [Plasmodium vivax Mauritania I]KMZ98490.1 long chain polyunsaturated fatty acid elongation enzyme [Plasmodium vivax North Korean]EDL46357.1 long chain poly|eukprot:XP_001616084.1 long chain polyunsaturated fatty acid elongation enzyme [Plasmodium vivax Sal-1]
MALNIAFINNLGENILKFFNPKLKYGRRVTKNWFMMNPTHFFLAFLFYVLFVLATYGYNAYYASKLKADKGLSKIKSSSSSKTKNARFDAILGKAIPLYNLLQVLLSLVITVMTIFEVRKRKFALLHNYVDFSKTNIALCCWLFYVNKLFDFMDTVLIVLRKKWNQFTFLHVYHHISVFLIMWVNTSVGYDGDIYYVITVNSIVHFIMYLYYFLASMKFNVPVFAKACVTYIQMIQFLAIIIPSFCVLFLKYNSYYPRRLIALSFYYCISLLLLFVHFAYNAYIRPKKKVA